MNGKLLCLCWFEIDLIFSTTTCLKPTGGSNKDEPLAGSLLATVDATTRLLYVTAIFAGCVTVYSIREDVCNLSNWKKNSWSLREVSWLIKSLYIEA